jgi:hypothetical protein
MFEYLWELNLPDPVVVGAGPESEPTRQLLPVLLADLDEFSVSERARPALELLGDPLEDCPRGVGILFVDDKQSVEVGNGLQSLQ